MRTFAQKQNQPQKPVSSSLTRPNTVTSGPGHHPILNLQCAIANQAAQRMLQTNADELGAGLAGTASPRFGQDFSRIPTYSPTEERYKRNWRSTSRGTNMSRRQTVSLNK